MRCKKCGKQKILVKSNDSKTMWIDLDSFTSEEIRECQTIPNSIIRFRPGVHILHYTTCKDNTDEISTKQKRTRHKSRYSGRIN